MDPEPHERRIGHRGHTGHNRETDTGNIITGHKRKAPIDHKLGTRMPRGGHKREVGMPEERDKREKHTQNIRGRYTCQKIKRSQAQNAIT